MSPAGVVLSDVLWLIELLIFARVALDWAGILVTGPAAGRWLSRPTIVVHRLSEPLLAPLRRRLPSPRLGSVRLDLAPVALLVIVALARVVVARL